MVSWIRSWAVNTFLFQPGKKKKERKKRKKEREKKRVRPKPLRAENVTLIANTLLHREMPNKTPIRMSYLLTAEFSRKFI